VCVSYLFVFFERDKTLPKTHLRLCQLRVCVKVRGLGKPILCRLGLHKWRNTGNPVEVSSQEPTLIKGGVGRGIATNVGVREGGLEVSRRAVYEGKECKRCGRKLRRRIVTNEDGTHSTIGWEDVTNKKDKQE